MAAALPTTQAVNPFTPVTFINDFPHECSNITFEWFGGKPPFTIYSISPGAPARGYPVPASAQRRYSFPLPYLENDEVVFMLSDDTSLNAGGPTRPFVVGNRRRSASPSCDGAQPPPDFSFTAPTILSQCEQANFTDFSGAEQPVTITGIVSRRQLFRLNVPEGSTTFSWPVRINAFEDVVFIMTDAKNRTSSASSIIQIAPANDISCLGSTTTPTPNPADMKKPAQRNMGVIGGSIGAGLFGLLLIAFIVWMVRRHKRRQRAIQAGIDLSPPRPEDMEMKRKSIAVENGDGHLVEMYVSTMKRTMAQRKAEQEAEMSETRAKLAKLQSNDSTASLEYEEDPAKGREGALAALTRGSGTPPTQSVKP